MQARVIAGLVSVAAVVSFGVGAGSSAASRPAVPSPAGLQSPFGCRAKIDGHTWLVTGHGMNCGTATAIVTTLSRKRAPGGYFKGTYSGMRCISTTPPGQKPQFIGCADGKGKNINAIRQ